MLLNYGGDKLDLVVIHNDFNNVSLKALKEKELDMKMTKEEKIFFCNKIIKSEIIRSGFKQSIQKVYDISTGKIKENSRGNER